MHRNVQPFDSERQPITAPAPTVAASSVTTHTTINDLPSDVLVPIFRPLVDEEAAEQRELFPVIQTPRVCARLALVNRRWKEVVYASPSLWSNFGFHLDEEETEDVQKRFDHLISLAKNAPVDLFLEFIHEHEGREVCYPNEFGKPASSDEASFPSLCRIPNLRSLCLHFLAIGWLAPITPETLPSLANVTYFHIGASDWDEQTINPADFFRRMPRLEELKMECMIFRRHYGRGLNNVLLLPRLRSLYLSLDAELYTSDFLALLAHCPNLEYLRIRAPMELDDSNTLVNLPKLLLLRITNEVDNPHPFASGLIRTPNLQEVKVDFDSWHPFDSWREFFKQNPAVETLTIPAYIRQIREAPNIQNLTVVLMRSDSIQCLLELADVEAREGDGSRICPTLRTLTILFRHSTMLPQYLIIEKLIRSRCLPIRRIDDELYTETGYKAIELLVLKFPSVTMDAWAIMKMTKSVGAQVESVLREKSIEYHLRWDFDVGDHLISKFSSKKCRIN
jgi:hypothetical protein